MKSMRSSLVQAMVLFSLMASTSVGAIEKIDTRPLDPSADRLLYGPTALPSRKGMQATAFDLGLWNIKGHLNDHFDLGVQTMPPFGLFVIGPTVRVRGEIAPKVHVGALGNVGFMTFLAGSDRQFIYYGGGPMITFGDERLALNVSSLVYGIRQERGRSGFAYLPSVGGSYQISNALKFNAEFYSFNAPRSGKYGHAFAVLYGLRFFSEKGKVFGDLGFIAPISKDTNKLYEFAPLGIPLVTLGFSF